MHTIEGLFATTVCRLWLKVMTCWTVWTLFVGLGLGRVEELKFSAFTARNTFPNNVLLLDNDLLVTFDNATMIDQFDYNINGRIFHSRPFEGMQGIHTLQPNCRGQMRKISYKASNVQRKCSLTPLTMEEEHVGKPCNEYSDFEWMATVCLV